MAFSEAQLAAMAAYSFNHYKATLIYGVGATRPTAMARLTDSNPKAKAIDDAEKVRREAMKGFALMVATVAAGLLWVADVAGWLA